MGCGHSTMRVGDQTYEELKRENARLRAQVGTLQLLEHDARQKSNGQQQQKQKAPTGAQRAANGSGIDYENVCTHKRKTLRELDLFVLDNSLRESTVGQTCGHVLEDSGQVTTRALPDMSSRGTLYLAGA